jgi:glycosyltransferase involved in cell wall biosynthesis
MSRITVIMPVYNAEKYLKQAIDSILNQSYENFELLLIDDASTDNSVDIIKKYMDKRIRLVQNETNMGIARTRNRGLELCNTDYIALMDDDDIAMSYRLEDEIRYLDDNPDIDIVGGHLRTIDKEGKDLNKQWSVYLNPLYIKAYLLLGNTVANGTAMFRKSFIEKFHIRYQTDSFGAEDYRFWVECSLYGKIKNLDKVYLLYRTGHGNETGRVISKHKLEREKTIRNIQIHALQQTGFKLNDDELNILTKVFKEDGIIETQDEIRNLYCALKSISRQAQQLNLENATEITTMCRKRFGEKIAKAFYLWDE